MQHALCLPAADFRQALTSALLYTVSSVDDPLSYICLHYNENTAEATINALDDHGFYQHTLRLDKDGIAPTGSLPPSQSFYDIGQLLIPQDAAKALIKLIPKKAGISLILLEVEYKPSPKPGIAAYHEVRCTYGFSISCVFQGAICDFPDYRPILSRALENKNEDTIYQGRVFPAGEFARIGKVLTSRAFFHTYWGKTQNCPCLLEYDENIRIVYMPGKWYVAA